MNTSEHIERRGERLDALVQTSRDTDMGKLLRMFWHPIAVGGKLEIGKARPIRVMGEDLTLYRGENGVPHLVGGRCAHRLTVLHTGWVEGGEIRCMYHGWKYDGRGRCTERPAERDTSPSGIKITGYPVHEYCGLIFAYLGDEPPPAFDLPRKDAFERPGNIVMGREESCKCNWLQRIENSVDPVHVSFVHQRARVGAFGQAVTRALPELEYSETEAGIRQVATRRKGNVRISDWTFPNSNHISVPGLKEGDPWIDIGSWSVPNDDVTTMRFHIWAVPSTNFEADRRVREHFEACAEYDPSAHHDDLFAGKYPVDDLMALTSAQDYVAQMGQGTIADRANETLGRSDAGIALLRRLYRREIENLRAGRPTKRWRRLEHPVKLTRQGPDEEIPTEPTVGGALSVGG